MHAAAPLGAGTIVAGVGKRLVAFELVAGGGGRGGLELVRRHWVDAFRPINSLHVGRDSGLIAVGDGCDSVRLFKYDPDLPRGFEVRTLNPSSCCTASRCTN